MNKPSEVVRYFEGLMITQRSSSDTFGPGYTKHQSSTKEGESSKSWEMINATWKKNKPTCYHCGKLGNTINICKRKIVKKIRLLKYRNEGDCWNHGNLSWE